MKQKLIQQLHNLISEHEISNYCTDYEDAENELDPQTSLMLTYDCGRYETLKEVLQIVLAMEA